MIDYTLAKRLKDNGFPQFCFRSQTYFDERGIAVICEETGDLEDNEYYIPSLEGAIEACGENFWGLTKLKLHPDLGWKAEQYVVGSSIEALGKTSLEAVLNLWLALNPKK